jgi:hypothetical protein
LTSPTRRTFLRTSALAVVSAGIALSPARIAFGQDTKNPSQDFQIPYEAKLDQVFSYKKATFDPYVGGTFTTRGANGRGVNLTLVAIREPAPTRAPRSPRRRGRLKVSRSSSAPPARSPNSRRSTR